MTQVLRISFKCPDCEIVHRISAPVDDTLSNIAELTKRGVNQILVEDATVAVMRELDESTESVEFFFRSLGT